MRATVVSQDSSGAFQDALNVALNNIKATGEYIVDTKLAITGVPDYVMVIFSEKTVK